jgi:hypothetical protein
MKRRWKETLFLCVVVLAGGANVFSLPQESEKTKYFILRYFGDLAANYLIVNKDKILITHGGLDSGENFGLDGFLYDSHVRSDGIILNKESIKAGQDGYFRLGDIENVDKYTGRLMSSLAENLGRRIIIPGENYYFIDELNLNHRFNSLVEALRYESQDPFDISPKKEDLNILSIRSDNFLTEGSVHYIPSGMGQKYYSDMGYCLSMFYGIPWAVRNSRGGIGEELTVRFRIPETNLNILNGFVDGERPHLYKANSRLKTVEITALESDAPFTIKADFEDVVHFKRIKLPHPARSVSIKVIDVYKGARYSDLAVTAIAGSNPYMAYREPKYYQQE